MMSIKRSIPIFLFLLVSATTSVNGATVIQDNKLSVDITTTCDCKMTENGKINGNTYEEHEVKAALEQGQTLQQTKKLRNGFPHDFGGIGPDGKLVQFPNPCQGPFMIHPILKGGKSASREAGLDRVVWDSKGKFCGCVTHGGDAALAVRGGFSVCK